MADYGISTIKFQPGSPRPRPPARLVDVEDRPVRIAVLDLVEAAGARFLAHQPASAGRFDRAAGRRDVVDDEAEMVEAEGVRVAARRRFRLVAQQRDRKSTRLNSSH